MKKPSAESRLLTLLFFGPPILVALAVFGPWELGWLPQVEGPYGQRYDPPTELPETSLQTPTGSPTNADWARGRWSLIYAQLSVCDGPCLARLELLRQVRFGLAEDAELVQRVYLHGGNIGALLIEGGLTAELVIGRVDGPAGAELRRALGEEGLFGGQIYIADPRGNLVMSYPPDADPQGILRDLERLLAVSRVV